jgi:hypothetical protein
VSVSKYWDYQLAVRHLAQDSNLNKHSCEKLTTLIASNYTWLKKNSLPRRTWDKMLLILDGKSSHCNGIQVLYFARANVVLLCLRPHATKYLQPRERILLVLDRLKSNTCTGLNWPWDFQEVEAPRLQNSRHMKVVRLSALSTGRLYFPGNIPSAHFCQRLSRPHSHSAAWKN